MQGANIGVEYSSNPARLIQQSGQFMSENIRQIGQQVQGTILELNTRKDLGRMVQNLSGLNVQSDEFPIQAAQIYASHPLAAQDPRGQMALAALGKAHNQWQSLKQAEARYSDIMNVPGVGAVRKSTGEVVAGVPTKPVAVSQRSRLVDPATGKVIVDALPEPDAFVSTPGGPMNKKTGMDVNGNPIDIPEKGALTEYQRKQLENRDQDQARMSKKEAAAAIKTQISQLDQDIDSAVRQYEASFQREEKATGDEKLRHQADKTEIGKIADQLKAKKMERMKALQDLQVSDVIDTPTPDLVPQGGVVPAPAATNQRIPVIDPNGVAGFLPAGQVEAALQNGYKRR